MIAMTSRTARLQSELSKALAAPWNWPLTPSGNVVVGDLLHTTQDVSKRGAWCKSERDRHRRQLPEVTDGLRSNDLFRVRQRVERNHRSRSPSQ